ncbi:MAG TPA: UDP-3-O-(3-hydroxymyristoyl)glucosamine N-acyltransferase [Candidatus Kapabacteria bacterium]|nr:UDP-3-O-(3-hydroxymyristoyl)glucosamine N-acyltransferase [Candidatus Kapabacteria bacterium]
MQAAEIAKLVGGNLLGDPSRVISGVRKIEEAGEGDISFIANPKYLRFHDGTQASALLVSREFETTRKDLVYIKTDDPYLAFLLVLRTFTPPAIRPEAGVHPTAVIASDAVLGENVSIGPHVVVGARSVIGDGAVIQSNTVLGEDVMVGRDTVIFPNVTLYHQTRIGERVIIHAGAVIGADGFGFLPRGTSEGWEKIPQTGIVVVEDDVEIGANVTIDRATLGETRIEQGVKLDNLVHIAHNVVLGRHTVIAAQAGISGSARIGERNMIAGQVGIVGHIDTVPDVIIEAQSGVSKSIRKPGRYFGHPVKEHAQALRQEGALRQLPDLLRDIRDMQRRIAQLEAALGVDAKE